MGVIVALFLAQGQCMRVDNARAHERAMNECILGNR